MAHWPRPRARCDRIAALAAGSEHLAVGCNLRGIALSRATDAPRSRTRSAEHRPPLGSRRQRRAALRALSGGLFHGVRCSGVGLSPCGQLSGVRVCRVRHCFSSALEERRPRQGRRLHRRVGSRFLSARRWPPARLGCAWSVAGLCAGSRCPAVLRYVLRVSYRFTKGLRSPHACGSRPPWVGDAWKARGAFGGRRMSRFRPPTASIRRHARKCSGVSLKIFPRKTAELERPVGAQTLPIVTRRVRKFSGAGERGTCAKQPKAEPPAPGGPGVDQNAERKPRSDGHPAGIAEELAPRQRVARATDSGFRFAVCRFLFRNGFLPDGRLQQHAGCIRLQRETGRHRSQVGNARACRCSGAPRAAGGQVDGAAARGSRETAKAYCGMCRPRAR